MPKRLLRVRVLSPKEAGIPGLSVALIATSGSKTEKSVTGNDGRADFAVVPDEHYEVAVSPINLPQGLEPPGTSQFSVKEDVEGMEVVLWAREAQPNHP